jgi:hypothetical protein
MEATMWIPKSERQTPERRETRVVRIVQDKAPRHQAQFQLELLRRCAEELEVASVPPDSDRAYINFLPQPRFGRRRLGSINVNSGRLEVELPWDKAGGIPRVEPYPVRGYPDRAKVYVNSAVAVDSAIELLRRTLDAR